MLCLSRKRHEKVIVRLPDGQELVIKVNEIKQNAVVLGFEGNKDTFTIVRKEIDEKSK